MTSKKKPPGKAKKPARGRKSKTKPAQSPAQGPIGNTGGIIIPAVSPNLSGGPTNVPPQPETPEEAREKEARSLMEKREGLPRGPQRVAIDDRLEEMAQEQEKAPGGIKQGTALGDYRKGVATSTLTTFRDRLAQLRGAKAGARAPVATALETAKTQSGLRVDGTAKIPCMVGNYNDIERKCSEAGGQAHHMVADKTFGTTNRGAREKDIGRIPGKDPKKPAQPFNAPSICLQGQAKVRGTEHNVAHEADAKVKKEGDRTDNGPPGSAPMKQIMRIYKQAAIAARPDCKDQIDKAFKDGYKNVDKSQSGRTTDSLPKDKTKDHLEAGNTPDQGRRTKPGVGRKN